MVCFSSSSPPPTPNPATIKRSPPFHRIYHFCRSLALPPPRPIFRHPAFPLPSVHPFSYQCFSLSLSLSLSLGAFLGIVEQSDKSRGWVLNMFSFGEDGSDWGSSVLHFFYHNFCISDKRNLRTYIGVLVCVSIDVVPIVFLMFP
ncbi:hypothetical protein RHGRI_001681 [Rhododendron griersonianum]|uniref:Uncharacterized protein n=1 Tax=Rhododendron griersonianum TaxID=479676 RepID=A0AAV6LM99_9ERIC|nr:hypothetical protein RHGRI_001681 [Rhododendron griersonianum]